MSRATGAKNKVSGEDNQALIQTEVGGGPPEDDSVKAQRLERTVGDGAPVQGGDRARGKPGAGGPGEALVRWSWSQSSCFLRDLVLFL